MSNGPAITTPIKDDGGSEGFSIVDGKKTDAFFWEGLDEDDDSPDDFDYAKQAPSITLPVKDK